LNQAVIRVPLTWVTAGSFLKTENQGRGANKKTFNLKFINMNTAALLTVRGMDWYPLPETVCRMDAAFELTRTYLQRVSGNGFQFMSRVV
jgi:hypothetical protein